MAMTSEARSKWHVAVRDVDEDAVHDVRMRVNKDLPNNKKARIADRFVVPDGTSVFDCSSIALNIIDNCTSESTAVGEIARRAGPASNSIRGIPRRTNSASNATRDIPRRANS